MHIFSNGRRKAAQVCDFRYRETETPRVCETLKTRKTMKSDAAFRSEMWSESVGKKASMAYLAAWNYLPPWGFTFRFPSRVVPASPVISSVALIPLFPIFPISLCCNWCLSSHPIPSAAALKAQETDGMDTSWLLPSTSLTVSQYFIHSHKIKFEHRPGGNSAFYCITQA